LTNLQLPAKKHITIAQPAKEKKSRPHTDLRCKSLILKAKDQAVKKKMKSSTVCSDFDIIDTRSALEDLAQKLHPQTEIAVDLEADSMYHYKEKVCLIQLAGDTITAVVDPLKIDDLSVLKALFNDRRIRKVIHGADYDVRSLYRDFRISIRNLFDTQLASRFLGYAETGLDAVVQQTFAVSLDKRFQRKDWSRRPLPQDMLAYAADDVRHLIPLARNMEAKLKETGRLSWVLEECALLSEVRPSANDGDPLFLHFKGAGGLAARSLAVLEAMLQYRKQVAQLHDRPLFRVISNKALLQLALDMPTTIEQLKRTDSLSPKQVARHGQRLLAAIQEAAALPQSKTRRYPHQKPPRVSPAMVARITALKKWRNRKAKQLSMDPSLLCSKALISAIAAARPHDIEDLRLLPDMRAWQREAFGTEILRVVKYA
jgi:ribonuclease D